MSNTTPDLSAVPLEDILAHLKVRIQGLSEIPIDDLLDHLEERIQQLGPTCGDEADADYFDESLSRVASLAACYCDELVLDKLDAVPRARIGLEARDDLIKIAHRRRILGISAEEAIEDLMRQHDVDWLTPITEVSDAA